VENILWPALPFIGLIGGFFSGFLGLGGGVVMFPLLTLVGAVPVKLATGTNLIHILIAAAISTVSHYRAGRVDTKSGIYLGIAGVGGGIIGSFLSVPLSPRSLQFIYLCVVGLAAVLLFIPLPIDSKTYRMGSFNKSVGVAIGLGVGSLAGLLGAGGGFITVPLMTYCLKIPLKVAIGTSLLIILITSLGTFWAKLGVGHIDLSITLLALTGSIPGALVGSFFSRKTTVRILRLALLSLLIAIFFMVAYEILFS
jgi:uncharacterized membrane protein YfcA